MIEAHLLKLRKRDVISAAEEAALRRLCKDLRRIPAHKTVISEGEPLNESLLLLEGWLARAKGLSGGERQFTEIHVPGDFADLHSLTLKRLDHDVVALTPVRLVAVPHDELRRLTEEFPHIARIYWFSTNVDAAIHREWAVSLGRRSALARTAHLFCELFERLKVVELTRGDSYDFPLTQDELATALGMTPVHINRTLQELRRQELIRLEHRQLTILDQDGLRKVAEFDTDYLYLDRRKI